MPARNNLQQLLQRLPLGNIASLKHLFIRMASDLGPEEREQLSLQANKGQCPLRQLLPEKQPKHH
jgi:hypothetical protein